MPTRTRRQFLKTAGQTAAVGAAAATFVESAQAARQTEKTVVALIGAGGQGREHLKLLAGNDAVHVAYVCDVDERALAAGTKLFADRSRPVPKTAKDLRRVLDDRTVEAVWIATPDHWHAPAAILACEAGKHVYVEKPCAHNFREAQLMVEAARRHKRVMQAGTQSRSTPHIQQAVEQLRAGKIGQVLVAKAWNSQRRRNIGHAAATEPPAYLDFDLWLGPAPVVPFKANMLPSDWRWWQAFGTGDMGNDGVHELDVARWGLGGEELPTRVAALGGKYFFDDDQQFPDTQYVVFEYGSPNGSSKPRQLVYEQRIWSPYVQDGLENGVAYYGTEGMLVVGKWGGYKLFGKKNKLIEEVRNGAPDLGAHHRNFLECMRTGQKPNADIEINRFSTALCHLGNIATSVGRVLTVDAEHGTIAGDSEASQLLRRQYREHWSVPHGA